MSKRTIESTAWGQITLSFIGAALVASGAAMWTGAESSLATRGLLPHGVCYTWNPSLIGLHLVSDTLIGLAYFSIPVTLVYFIRKRRDLPFNWMFLLFGLFIVACGTTHWMEVWTLWEPHYWLAGAVKAVTAAASVPTAIALALLIPQALAIPSTRELAEAKCRLETEVAERMRIEGELRQAQATLEARVAERTREFERATNEARHAHQALKDSDQRKDRFLAILSHELRNPLNPILSSVAILRQAPADAAQCAMAREVIDRQVAHMARLLDDLLDVSRITRDRLVLIREPLDVTVAVNSATEATRTLFHAAHQRLEVSLPDQPLYVNADATRLSQVLCNLLNNASKYTDAGGDITLNVSRQGREAVIKVSDTGSGIQAADLDRVFELFARVESERNHSIGGLGIGLALVKSLVQMHGGTVSAASAGLRHGSEFTIRLPLIEVQALHDTAAAEKARAPVQPMRVLVVDDNADSAQALAMLLSISGHEVRHAGSAYAALEIAPEFRPHIGIFDIGMPGMDGYELARRARQQAWGKSMRLVALTGWGKDEDKQLARAAGFDDHLTKPADPADLEQQLRQAERESA